jgi:hypothetical protein
MTHRFRHLKRYAIAFTVLSLVLAGTAYASVRVAQRSTAGITCGGSCPAKTVLWAYVSAVGQANSLSPGPTVTQTALGGTPANLVHVGVGSWMVFFSGKQLTNCARFANLTSIRGSATVGQFNSANPDPEGIPVMTTDAQGNPVDADFVVVALCGGGIGAQSTTGGVVG